MTVRALLTFLVALLIAGGAASAQEADLEHGKAVFRKCQACHSVEAGANKVGPTLHQLFGRQAGTVPGFNYSDVLVNSGVIWTEPTIDAYLANPRDYLPGNKMTFVGLKQEADRRDVIAWLREAAGAAPVIEQAAAAVETFAAEAAEAAPVAAPPAATTATGSPPPGDVTYTTQARYTLRTGIAEGRMVFIGVGGTIDGRVNPDLTALEGQVIQITLINGEGAEHDIVLPDYGIASQRIIARGASTTVVFRAGAAGTVSEYYCSTPGHRLAGMLGRLVVSAPAAEAEVATDTDITLDPAEVPPPIGERGPQTVPLELETVELDGRLADGTTYNYWTFNRTVPGPFLRVRVGDTIDVRLKNDADAVMIHSVDFHAATGPGGGAAALQVPPGEEKSLKWKALIPGIYVYHCATPMVAHHIASGMYGLILVEPEGGLPPVDHEFYVMQGEIYTEGAFGIHGAQEFSVDKLLDEEPEYFVFNGAVGAITSLHPMHVRVGETVRIYMGVGGPNFSSSFHVIGEIFDRVYPWGDVISPPARGIQTVTVPAGGAVIVEFKIDVPGRYILVDHALSRVERGLVGFIIAEGDPVPEIFAPSEPMSDDAH